MFVCVFCASEAWKPAAEHGAIRLDRRGEEPPPSLCPLRRADGRPAHLLNRLAWCR